MKKYKNLDSKQITEVYCNRCGKKLRVEHGIVMEGVFSGDVVWGYFSDKDTQHHSFDLCEACYDNMIQEFVIPADLKIEKELL